MEFKKLSDVEVVEAVSDSANVLIEENGVIKKAPKTQVGGAGGGNVASGAPYLVKINYNSNDDSYTLDGDFWEIDDVIRTGAFVYAAIYNTDVNYFSPSYDRFYFNNYAMPDDDVFYFYNAKGNQQLIIYSGGSAVISNV